MFDDEWEYKEKIENKLKIYLKMVFDKYMKSKKEDVIIVKNFNFDKDVNVKDDEKF